MSLRLKIAAALAALAGIIAALAAGGAYVTAARQLDRTIDETLLERASAAVNDTSRPGRGEPGNRQPFMPGRARCPDVNVLQTFTAAQLGSPAHLAANPINTGTGTLTLTGFDAGTGALTLTSLKGPIHLTSDDLTGSGLSYRDAGGATINRTAFFAAATAGKLVKAKGTLSGGVVTWSELELQN